MKRNILSRIMSGGLLATIIGFAMHISEVHDVQVGRAAYLAKKAASFDQHAAHPIWVVSWVITSLIIYGIFIGVYELVTFAILKVLERINRDDANS